MSALEEAHIADMVLIQVYAWECKRCEHIWLPRDRTRRPKVCPKCKSPYWDTRRKARALGEAS